MVFLVIFWVAFAVFITLWPSRGDGLKNAVVFIDTLSRMSVSFLSCLSFFLGYNNNRLRLREWNINRVLNTKHLSELLNLIILHLSDFPLRLVLLIVLLL